MKGIETLKWWKLKLDKLKGLNDLKWDLTPEETNQMRQRVYLAHYREVEHGWLLFFVKILVRFKGLGVVSCFQKCNLGGFCKTFDIVECQAKIALTN